MSESVAKPILAFKDVVESVVHVASSWVDTCAERVVRDGLGWVPEGEAQRDSIAQHSPSVAGHVMKDGRITPPGRVTVPTSVQVRDTGSQFADTEEIEWLESGRRELPYRRDRQWAVPQMWWEMAFGGIGATTYMVSSVARNPLGMAAGWALAAGGKGILLLADLGRPERFPRVFVKPNTSWIARGSWAFGAFAAAGAVSLLPCIPQPVRTGAAVVANTGAGVLAVYDGLFINDAKGVQSWMPREVPALFTANALQAGAALSGALADKQPRWMRCLGLASGIASAGLSARYIKKLGEGSTATRLSARDLVEGVQRDRFVVAGGIIGTALPIVLTVCAPTSKRAGAVAGAAAAVGVEHLRRAVLQAGIHAPVIDPPRTRPAGEGRKN
ncbi:MAG: hypothetical protein ACTHW1_08670 [Ancrocorticia sp.]|uniref:hypothetical protein n=1 Tax=Ancrocorticia sp. TaxID=2593684 RepID=UPI003F8FCA4F